MTPQAQSVFDAISPEPVPVSEGEMIDEMRKFGALFRGLSHNCDAKNPEDFISYLRQINKNSGAMLERFSETRS